MKDSLNRIRELEVRNEALETAIEQIRAATWRPKMTLAELKRRIGNVLLELRSGQKERGS